MKNKKLYVILGGVLILSAVSAGAFYYIKRKNKTKDKKMLAEKNEIKFSSEPQKDRRPTVANGIPVRYASPQSIV